MARVLDFDLVAEQSHISCGVELEFMSRIPKPKGCTEYYPYELVTKSLNQGSKDLKFEFNDLSGAEKFDYDNVWTITLDETLKPDSLDQPFVSGPSNSMSSHDPNRKRYHIGGLEIRASKLPG